MKCDFVVGQKVACIADDWGRAWWDSYVKGNPVKGEIYTIRTIIAIQDRVWLRFSEIVNPSGSWFDEVEYAAVNFRPLVERKTDIAVFERMLTDQRITENA